MKKKKVNGHSPATQHDLSSLAGEMTRRFDEMEGRFDKLEGRFDILEGRTGKIEKTMATKDDIARLERGQKAMLGVLQSIDEHFRDHRALPERVARLERSEFGRP